jgi:hypothetical protein
MNIMTRKDYIKFANALKLARDSGQGWHKDHHDVNILAFNEGFSLATGVLIHVLREDNPKFDANRFLDAIYTGTPHEIMALKALRYSF